MLKHEHFHRNQDGCHVSQLMREDSYYHGYYLPEYLKSKTSNYSDSTTINKISPVDTHINLFILCHKKDYTKSLKIYANYNIIYINKNELNLVIYIKKVNNKINHDLLFSFCNFFIPKTRRELPI